MGDKVMVEPRHVMWRALPDSLRITNEILSRMGRKTLKVAYVAIVPDARFYTYRYQIGAVMPIRVVGEGQNHVRGSKVGNVLICAGHRELVNKVRKVPVTVNRINRGQTDYEKDTDFLTRAHRGAFREIVGWEHINNRNTDNLVDCRYDVKLLKPFKLYGEIVWIPRRNYDYEPSECLIDGILTPSYDPSNQAFYVPKYDCPPEVKARAKLAREKAAHLPPLPDNPELLVPELGPAAARDLRTALYELSPLMIRSSHSPASVDKDRIRTELLNVGLDVDARRFSFTSLDEYDSTLGYGAHTVSVWLSSSRATTFAVHVFA